MSQYIEPTKLVRTTLGEYYVAELRHVASEWHSGQWSAFYAFSSSGTAVSGLATEALLCAARCDDDVEADKLRAIATLEPEESEGPTATSEFEPDWDGPGISK